MQSQTYIMVYSSQLIQNCLEQATSTPKTRTRVLVAAFLCIYWTIVRKKWNRNNPGHLSLSPPRLVSQQLGWPKYLLPALLSRSLVAVLLAVQWLSATRRRGELSCPGRARAWWWDPCPRMPKKVVSEPSSPRALLQPNNQYLSSREV